MHNSLARIAPLSASLITKCSQFVLLLVIGRTFGGNDQHFFVIAFGLSGALGLLFDSGAAQYILTLTANTSKNIYNIAILFHALGAFLGQTIAVGILVLSISARPENIWISISSIFMGQWSDSVLRVIRITELRSGNYIKYSLPELLVSLCRISLLSLVIFINHVLLCIWGVIGLIAVILFYRIEIRTMEQGQQVSLRRRIKICIDILSYGVSGILNASYAETPILMVPAFFSALQSSMILSSQKIFQALEILPSTFSVQYLHAMKKTINSDNYRHMLVSGVIKYGLLGLFMGIIFIVLTPIFGAVSNIRTLNGITLMIFALGLLFKAINYFLSSALLAINRPTIRSLISVFVLFVSVTTLPSLSVRLHAAGVGVSIIISEIVFLVIASIYIRKYFLMTTRETV